MKPSMIERIIKPHLLKIGEIILVLFFITLSQTSFGQAYKLNFGLTSPQDSITLPKSKVATVFPKIKAKTQVASILKKKGDREWILTKGWEMIAAGDIREKGSQVSNVNLQTKSWYNATVPGTVLTTLVDQGVYPDPYFGLNNLSIPDSLSKKDWWYRISFDAPVQKDKKNAWLIFNGINYAAEIWLNGKKIGRINGAFKRGEFNVTSLLYTSKRNVLAVHILPVKHPGIPHEESARSGKGPNGGSLTFDGPTFISSEGWDWIPGIRDRNVGIWQDVRLKLEGPLRLIDPQVITDLPLPDTSQANLVIKTGIYNSNSKERQSGLITVKLRSMSLQKKFVAAPGETIKLSFTPTEFRQLIIKAPKLWWPNGYGNQALYNLDLELRLADGTISDTKRIRFGFRELSYEMSVDLPTRTGERIEFNPIKDLARGKTLFDNVNRREALPGVWVPRLNETTSVNELMVLSDVTPSPYLVFKVNGKRIFCKGGNWGMDDGMKRSSRNNLEPAFRLHKDAGFNMIRNWTGESTQESLYELADEYGMLIWNDFWISTEGYNLYPLDNALFLDNATDVIRRFRNHPSIAIWCARNEGAPQEIIENGLASLIAKEDGTRLYQPNSRNLNLRPSGPWHYITDPRDYFTKMAKGFSTELGTPAVPTAATMRKMMPVEDTWPISDTWYYHDLHNGQKEYRSAIDSLYGKALDLDDFCKKAQMVNYQSHRAMFEAWNSKQWNNTSGLLLWMTHPAWPSTVWQVYSWDYETFAAYFGASKACEPIHIQMNLDDRGIVVANTSLKMMNQAVASLSIFDLLGKEVFQKQIVCNIAANNLTPIFPADIPNLKKGTYLIRLTLKDSDGRLVSENDYWHNIENKDFTSFNKLDQVTLKIDYKPADGKQIVTISNPSAVMAIGIKLNAIDPTTKEIVLPAYFSEGYFNLLPGETKRVTVDIPPSRLRQGLGIISSGYNIGQGAY